MFDIGFTELVIIAVVSLLVIGPERLPSAVRTASLWLNRIKRGFSDIKREVEQELHNDAVLQELRKTGEELQSEAHSIGDEIREVAEPLNNPPLMKGGAAHAGAAHAAAADAAAADAGAADAGAAHAGAAKTAKPEPTAGGSEVDIEPRDA